MVVQKNFLLKLRDFGLNSYESRLWTALLSRGSSTAGELSDIANVPRSRAYDVLETLEKKGFILRKIGKPITYAAVPPSQVVDRVKQRVAQEALEQAKVFDELKNSSVLSELSALHEKGVELVEPSELTASISGRDNLYHHLESRIAKAKQTVTLLTTAEGMKRKIFLLPALRELKRKGVSVRIATQITPELKPLIAEYAKVADVRHTPMTGRLCISDSKEVTLMLQHDSADPSYDMAVWMHSPYFASTLQSLFDEKWQGMK
ncbi:MAG: helix-turn-helix domain-containing protein [Nanoarchaeota archaeon]|nr:helix-turn-helix domain-containing protein [Nanoarchaeota archaeon]